MSEHINLLNPNISKKKMRVCKFLAVFDTSTLTVVQKSQNEPGMINIEIQTNSPAKFLWLWHGIPIEESDERLNDNVEQLGRYRYRCTLKIYGFSNYDAGKFSIMAYNDYGQSRFDFEIGQDVEWNKPRILAGPTISYLGQNRYKLEVKVWSPGNNKITWSKFRKGQEVNLNTEALCNDSNQPKIAISAVEGVKNIYDITLSICEITRKDRGTYRCVIENEKETIYCDFPILCEKGTPEGRPELFAEPKILHLKSQNIIMAFCIRSSEEPRYFWILPDDTYLPSDKMCKLKTLNFSHRKLKTPDNEEEIYEGRLTIDHWATAKKGTYTCLVENVYGCLEIKFELSASSDVIEDRSTWHKNHYSV